MKRKYISFVTGTAEYASSSQGAETRPGNEILIMRSDDAKLVVINTMLYECKILNKYKSLNLMPFLNMFASDEFLEYASQ